MQFKEWGYFLDDVLGVLVLGCISHFYSIGGGRVMDICTVYLLPVKSIIKLWLLIKRWIDWVKRWLIWRQRHINIQIAVYVGIIKFLRHPCRGMEWRRWINRIIRVLRGYILIVWGLFTLKFVSIHKSLLFDMTKITFPINSSSFFVNTSPQQLPWKVDQFLRNFSLFFVRVNFEVHYPKVVATPWLFSIFVSLWCFLFGTLDCRIFRALEP